MTFAEWFSRMTILTVLILIAGTSVMAQGTAFTYQGTLTDGGTPANGSYDLQFGLFDSLSGGSQVGSTQTVLGVSVSSGVFTVLLEFGNAFTGAGRFLEISARPAGSGSFTLLTPRQPITSTPYAVRSLRAASADGLSSACVGCVQDANINTVAGSKVSGAISVANVPAGSNSYIQNGNTPQANSAFRISGVGTANIFNADTQYDLGGTRVLRATANVTFVGAGAGTNNTGAGNAFFGSLAGNTNTSGFNNSFFGDGAGRKNNIGNDNAFFGVVAGNSNTEGARNSFFGGGAGFSNTTESDNSFFGNGAGFKNGNFAKQNSFFGSGAGGENQNGSNNSFFGYFAGAGNVVGSSNAIFGANAGLTSDGQANSFFGFDAGRNSKFAGSNAFFGYRAGLNTTAILPFPPPLGTLAGANNTFLGALAGQVNTVGTYNTLVGYSADVSANNLDHATAIGAESEVSTSETIALGRVSGPDTVLIYGKLQINTLANAGSTQLCLNGSNRVGPCSSSLRYKSSLAPYRSGLSVVNRLRPISFTWKDRGIRDLGFGAEDVEKIDPLLVVYNAAGEVEGVKYDRLNVVLVNAIKQQQKQIEQQQDQIASLYQANARLSARLRVIESGLRRKNGAKRRGR